MHDIIPANPAEGLRVSDATMLATRLDDARALAVPVDSEDVAKYIEIARAFMGHHRDRMKNAGAKLLMAALRYNLDRAKVSIPPPSGDAGGMSQIAAVIQNIQLTPDQRQQLAEFGE